MGGLLLSKGPLLSNLYVFIIFYLYILGSSSVARGPDSAAPVSAPAPAPAAPVLVPGVTGNSQTQTGQHSRLQHDSSVAPAPVRYVNYLAYQGYSVEIIGGKHFKTPEGEFVEIKSGTQYKIHVKNSRAYGKDSE